MICFRFRFGRFIVHVDLLVDVTYLVVTLTFLFLLGIAVSCLLCLC